MKAFAGQAFWPAAGLLPGVSLAKRETQFRTESFDRALWPIQTIRTPHKAQYRLRMAHETE
jgi:hypothetical protein